MDQVACKSSADEGAMGGAELSERSEVTYRLFGRTIWSVTRESTEAAESAQEEVDAHKFRADEMRLDWAFDAQRIAELEAIIAQVRDIHRRHVCEDPHCATCLAEDAYCHACDLEIWPCTTAQILDGTEAK